MVDQKIEISNDVDKYIDEVNIPKAIEFVFENYINPCNEKLNKTEPWKMDKDSPERKDILIDCIHLLNNAAAALEPIMPESCKYMLETFNGQIINKKIPLFKRL